MNRRTTRERTVARADLKVGLYKTKVGFDETRVGLSRTLVVSLLLVAAGFVEAGLQTGLRVPGLAVLAAQTSSAQRHGQLFPPTDLGLLETPDRAAWQKPDQIMDALKIADGAKVADIGAGGGFFTIRLARRVGPNGFVYA